MSRSLRSTPGATSARCSSMMRCTTTSRSSTCASSCRPFGSARTSRSLPIAESWPKPAHQLLERVAEGARVAGEVGVEQRAADDRERQRRHLVDHVDLLAVGPGAAGAARPRSPSARRTPRCASRWNAGCASRRWRRWNSPSLVSRPLPSSGRVACSPRPFITSRAWVRKTLGDERRGRRPGRRARRPCGSAPRVRARVPPPRRGGSATPGVAAASRTTPSPFGPSGRATFSSARRRRDRCSGRWRAPGRGACRRLACRGAGARRCSCSFYAPSATASPGAVFGSRQRAPGPGTGDPVRDGVLPQLAHPVPPSRRIRHTAGVVDTVTVQDIQDARAVLRGVARETPLRSARWLADKVGGPVDLKCENLQRAGSFKIRGAYMRLARLSDEERARGRRRGQRRQPRPGGRARRVDARRAATVFMPVGAPLPKVPATRGYGADIRFVGSTIDECLVAARAFAGETGAVLIHPFDHPDIVAGQGTVGLEILEQRPDVRTIVVCTGGGGLLAGIAVAVKAMRPDVRIVGVQAAGAAAYPRSLAQGHPVALAHMSTMADGIAVGCPGDVPFALVRRARRRGAHRRRRGIARALVLTLERSKLVVEPAGAAGLAAVLDDPASFEPPVVVVVSGGNVDPLLLLRVVRARPRRGGRYTHAAGAGARPPGLAGRAARRAGRGRRQRRRGRARAHRPAPLARRGRDRGAGGDPRARATAMPCSSVLAAAGYHVVVRVERSFCKQGLRDWKVTVYSRAIHERRSGTPPRAPHPISARPAHPGRRRRGRPRRGGPAPRRGPSATVADARAGGHRARSGAVTSLRVNAGGVKLTVVAGPARRHGRRRRHPLAAPRRRTLVLDAPGRGRLPGRPRSRASSAGCPASGPAACGEKVTVRVNPSLPITLDADGVQRRARGITAPVTLGVAARRR